ncbi:unnamed protein product [Rangifer tarandus platyrhynchus]|uniref:Uncharacterized protein n=1 Tax=Rangifer tarandus platyrhynchus TaxID=3082113 RepID=A0ABN8XJA7_RANTA|nr:unnamed protein product [Rangifer tarandus platyrhynchus]
MDAHKRRWDKTAGDVGGAMYCHVAACCRPDIRWKDTVLHRAVEMPSWQAKHVVMAMECLMYAFVCNLFDPAPAHTPVLSELVGIRWQRGDFLHREISVRSKTTVLSVHR